jgi:hypothetical protein
MPCSECPHCRVNASRRSLRLNGPPGNHGAAGVDMAFYMAFGRAYDRARTLDPQPMKLLRDVNPWLTASQCRSYLKRARALGQVQTPGRLRRTASTVAATASAPDGTAADILSDPWIQAAVDLGVPVTRSRVAAAISRHDPDTVLAALRDSGWTERPDGALVAG